MQIGLTSPTDERSVFSLTSVTVSFGLTIWLASIINLTIKPSNLSHPCLGWEKGSMFPYTKMRAYSGQMSCDDKFGQKMERFPFARKDREGQFTCRISLWNLQGSWHYPRLRLKSKNTFLRVSTLLKMHGKSFIPERMLKNGGMQHD